MIKSQNLREEVSQELIRRGYRRVDRMHLRHVHGDWHFWVDTGPLGNHACISPFVGIRNDVLEHLVSEFLALPPDDSAGSLGANIGYILDGKYREWNSDARAVEVLGAIDAAFERLSTFMELEKLAAGWQIEGTQDPLWRYREIFLLLLRRDAAQAKMKLTSLLSKKNREAGASRRFKRTLRALCSQSVGCLPSSSFTQRMKRCGETLLSMELA